MNYFLDTEFTKLPWENNPELISIGIVDENNKTLYLCLNNFNEDDVSDFVKERVISFLPPKNERVNQEDAIKSLKDFFSDNVPSNFWSIFPRKDHLLGFGIKEDVIEEILETYADFDFQLLKKLMKEKYPDNWVQKGANLTPIADKLKSNGNSPENKKSHDALSDALWNKDVFDVYHQG